MYCVSPPKQLFKIRLNVWFPKINQLQPQRSLWEFVISSVAARLSHSLRAVVAVRLRRSKHNLHGNYLYRTSGHKKALNWANKLYRDFRLENPEGVYLRLARGRIWTRKQISTPGHFQEVNQTMCCSWNKFVYIVQVDEPANINIFKDIACLFAPTALVAYKGGLLLWW